MIVVVAGVAANVAEFAMGVAVVVVVGVVAVAADIAAFHVVAGAGTVVAVSIVVVPVVHSVGFVVFDVVFVVDVPSVAIPAVIAVVISGSVDLVVEFALSGHEKRGCYRTSLMEHHYQGYHQNQYSRIFDLIRCNGTHQFP